MINSLIIAWDNTFLLSIDNILEDKKQRAVENEIVLISSKIICIESWEKIERKSKNAWEKYCL